MSELYDAEGNPVEGALTHEEVEEKINEAIEEHKQNSTEETEALKTELEEQKTALEAKEREIEELANEDDKTKNLVQLRKAKEIAEKEKGELSRRIGELESTFTQKVEEVEKKVTSEKLNSAVQKLAGNDKELADKIKIHYDNFKGVPKDDTEMNERLQNAYILSTGSKPESPLGAGTFGSGTGIPAGGGSSLGKPSQEAKDVGKMMGITDEDWKKYGGQKQL
jgi:myosin heavy subunit